MTDYQDTVEFEGAGTLKALTAYPAWAYIQTITITNSTGGELTDFQVLVTLTAGTFDYASAKADGSDLRFTASDKLTPLPYWIQSWTQYGTSYVWVKVASVPNGASAIYLFYGNAAAASESDGDSSFVFFDDFEDGVIDTNKWQDTTGFTESGGCLNGSNTTYRIRSKNTISGNHIIEARHYCTSISTNGYQACGFQVSASDGINVLLHPTNAFYCRNDGAWVGPTTFTFMANWVRLKVTAIGSSSKARITRESDSGYTEHVFNNSGLSNEYIKLGKRNDDGNPGQGYSAKWDWLFLRKYATTEPSCALSAASSNDQNNLSLEFALTETIEGEGSLTVVPSLALVAQELAGSGAISLEFQQALQALVEFEGTGAVNAPLSYIFVDLDTFLTEGWDVTKNIQDVLWRASANVDKLTVPSYFTNFRVTAYDHEETLRCVFLGFIPGAGYTLAPAANKATIEGYDYGWYLSAQYVPVALRQTDEDTNPADTIKALLGGDQWETTTGLEPYKINSVTGWGTSLAKKQFISDSKASKWKLIQEICEYCHFMFVVKAREDPPGIWSSAAYFIHEDDIDTELDLPAIAVFTDPDPYLMQPTTIQDKQSDKINRVIVNGVNKITGTWYTKTVEDPAVTAGDELPIEYLTESTDLGSQVLVDARATELYNFFNSVAKVYTVRLKKRFDLELYQKAGFVGYSNIPEYSAGPPEVNAMRVTSIHYSHRINDDVVEVQFSLDTKYSDLKRLMRLMGADFMNEEQRIKEDFFIDLTKIAVGEITAIDGNEATVKLEKDEGLVKARLLE